MNPDKIPLKDKIESIQGLIVKEMIKINQDLIDIKERYKQQLIIVDKWLEDEKKKLEES